MWYALLKVVVSAVIITGISELAKRSTLLGVLLASLPLISVLGICWLYWETRDTARIAQLSFDIFWLVLPSLALFLVLPLLLKRGLAFTPVLLCAAAVTVALYLLMLKYLPQLQRHG